MDTDSEYPPPPSVNHDPKDGNWVLDIPKYKILKLNNLNKLAQYCASKAISAYPEFETKTWEDQRRECVAWAGNNSTVTPYIDALASYREIDRNTYIQRTLAKISAFSAFATKIVGLRQKYADMIDAATSEEELNAIVFDFS